MGDLPHVAGCDVFTAPCEVLGEFLAQTEVTPDMIGSQLETSFEDRLAITDERVRALGPERIARLWRVEREFIEFLREFRSSAEYRELDDGERLWRRFQEAGFRDVFYVPDEGEWRKLRAGKLHDPESRFARELAPDTYMSLLADGDFVNHQEAIDAELLKRATD